MAMKTGFLVAAAVMAVVGATDIFEDVEEEFSSSSAMEIETSSRSRRGPKPFRFALALGNGMILQSAPYQAMIWGFCAEGSKVSVDFEGKKYTATIGPDQAEGKSTTWRVLLPANPASFDNHSIGATLEGGATIGLEGVRFGEVWVCSGQSNMAYPLGDRDCWDPKNEDCSVQKAAAQCKYGCVNNSEAEIDALPAYDHGMSVLVVHKSTSTVPLPDLPLRHGWRTPSATGKGLSATCWFTMRDIYEKLSPRVPVGMIITAVGGTPDQYWSSPDALKKCEGPNPWNIPAGYTSSTLWNSMVVGLLRTTIRGAVWYQGEANSGADGRQYNCSFPAMINDWRSKWHAATDQATDATFPFGWVQLNCIGRAGRAYSNPTLADNVTYGEFGQWAPAYPALRLAQSNTLKAIERSFMAVVLDTPVARGSVHSPYKQPVGQRLARGALATAYGQSELVAVNPVASEASVSGLGGDVVVQLTGLGRQTTAKTGANGFEVLGADSVWHSTPIKSIGGGAIVVGPAPKGARAVRYLWYDSPCGANRPYQCPVYTSVTPIGTLSGENQPFLPLAPFLLPIQSERENGDRFVIQI